MLGKVHDVKAHNKSAKEFKQLGKTKYKTKNKDLTTKAQHLLADLEAAFNYKFKEVALLKLALTHRSLTSDSNERLEFLGDAVFNLVISDYLYNKYPSAKEGLLSRMRAKLVSKATLQKVAASIEIAKYIKVGPAENKNFNSRQTSVGSDAVEAIIGAVYVDGGIRKARSVVMRLFKAELDDLDINNIYKDYKTRLQELIQSNYHKVPNYRLKQQHTLDENSREFLVLCTVPNHGEAFLGKGANRKEAEQDAARHALSNLSNKLSLG